MKFALVDMTNYTNYTSCPMLYLWAIESDMITSGILVNKKVYHHNCFSDLLPPCPNKKSHCAAVAVQDIFKNKMHRSIVSDLVN